MLCADSVTPRQGQGQWKWYKMLEVNGAYKHDRYEKIWLRILSVMANIKVFVTQDGQPASWLNATHNTYPYDTTDMDKQPSWTSELLHTTLQQNNCTSSSFLITLWLWLSEHQGHSNWNQAVEFGHVHHHTKFATNRFTGVPTHDNAKCIFHKITSAKICP